MSIFHEHKNVVKSENFSFDWTNYVIEFSKDFTQIENKRPKYTCFRLKITLLASESSILTHPSVTQNLSTN